MCLINGMYIEKNFLNHRDVEAYGKRQAESCLYLDRKIEEWISTGVSMSLRIVLRHLQDVHARQYSDLMMWLPAGTIVDIPDSSFYFESLDGETRNICSLPALILNCVSYERGRMRYAMMRGFPGPWGIFERDATFNCAFCCVYLEEIFSAYFSGKMVEVVDRVVAAEADVMRKIDERNGK